jgi:alkanesulfonate monooxygenase SsuD/methylene tetrahydromethanopterin reductase-like flavin-dependent oxidoreductase (luciferase family)
MVLKGLTTRTLDFAGKHFRADNIPMQLEPLQKPYPPIWYGVHAPDSARRAAQKGLRVMGLDSSRGIAECFDRFREAWHETQGGAALPLMGIGRFVVVAPTDAAALVLARRAYPRWHTSFNYLTKRAGYVLTHPRPPTWDELVIEGRGIAGSPRTVAALVQQHLEETGGNYFVGQFAFGDLTLAESITSAELFAAEVMPTVRRVTETMAAK